MRGACWWVLILLSVVACVRPAVSPRTPAPPLLQAQVRGVFDPLAQVEGRPSSHEAGPLRVLDVQPVDRSGGLPIQLRFDRPVARADALPEAGLVVEQQRRDGRWINVEGVSAWARTDRLRFEPRTPLPGAHRIRVRLEGAVDGIEDVGWSFETQPPGLDLVEGWRTRRSDESFWVWCDELLSPDVLAAHLEVRDEAGRAVPVRVERATEEDDSRGSMLVVSPATRWPPGETLRVEVEGDFRTDGGVLPLGEALVWSLETLAPFRIRGITCADGTTGPCPLGPVTLELGNDPEALEGIRMHPKPEGFAVWWAEHGVVLGGNFEPGRRYTIILPRDLQDDDAQRLEGPRTTTVRFTDVQAPGYAALRLSSTSGVFAQPQDARIGVLGGRVRAVEVRISVLDPTAAAPYLRHSNDVPWPTNAPTTRLEVELTGGTRVLDLSRFAGRGDTVLVEVRPTSFAEHTTAEIEPVRGVFRISALGVWTHSGPARGILRASALDTGHPIAGAHVEAVDEAGTRVLGKTNADGLLALPGAVNLDAPTVLVVRSGDDALAVPLRAFPWGADHRNSCRVDTRGRCSYRRARDFEGEHPQPAPPKPLRPGERALVELGIGRSVFMPGETIHVAGWAGVSTPHRKHNTRRVPKGTTAALTLVADGTTVASRTTTVSADGRFVESIRIPQEAALGSYAVTVEMLGGSDRVGLAVSEVRLPTFEVDAEPKRDEIVRGEVLEVDVRAKYLSGEPAPLRQLDWTVDCHGDGAYLPDLDEAFSVWTDAAVPLWTRRGRLTGTGTTLQLRLATDTLDHRSARFCAVSVAGQDASHQPVGTDTWVFVHPGPGYVALAVPQPLRGGDRPLLRAMVVDRQGQPLAAERLGVALDRLEGRKSIRLKQCETESVGAGVQVRCRAPALAPGKHEIRVWAEVGGETLELERHVEVQSPPPPEVAKAAKVATASPEVALRPPEPEPTLEMHGPDEAKWGEPIALSITAPWWSAEGVLTVEQTGLRETRPFTLHRGKAQLTVRAAEGAGPLLELTARVDRPDAPRPDVPRARAEVVTASHTVHVEDRTHLKVDVLAPDQVTPGSETAFTVRVHDAQGHPIDARLAVWVVDDAVHQLRGPPRVALEQTFNPPRPLESVFTDMRAALLEPFNPFWRSRGVGTPRIRQAKAEVRGALDVVVRQRFDPAPLFIGDIGTGPDGSVRIPLRLADDLTRFRIEVIASAELAAGTGPAIFGRGEARIEATTPLPVRAALPRTLRPGDTAQLAAIVTVAEDGTLEVRAQTKAERIQVVGPTARVRRVQAGQVVRVPFSVEAARVGDDTVSFSAILRRPGGEALRGAVARPLAVQPERTSVERAAVYGSVATDRPVAIPVVLPTAARGSIDVAVTTTALGDLRDAAEYLVDYPYGCVEQTASRLIPLVAMRSLPGVPNPQKRIAEAIAHLQSMQLPSGHYTYWPGTTEVSRVGTAYATWVLLMARDAGVMVPAEGLARALNVLRADLAASLPDTPAVRDNALVERVMALRAVAESGPVSPDAIERVWVHRGRLPAFSRLLLLQALHRIDPTDVRIAPLLMSLSSSIEQRQGVVHVVDPSESQWWWAFASQTRSDAIALMTLQQVAPDDPRIEKLVAGLREARRGGRWRNTQENAFALLALSRYASAAESVTPEHRVQAWIGTTRVVDVEQLGFDVRPRSGVVSLREALGDRRGDRAHVVIHREGQGRAYYRVGVEWTPQDAPARSQGLSIHRTIPTEIGVGDTAMIQVSLWADAAVHHLAVEVPLPAGLEAVDTALGGGARARVLGSETHSAFLSHREVRPDRVVLFFDSLPPGTTEHTIPIVATTPGRYTMPAAVAEAMYEPETRARTTVGVVRVFERAPRASRHHEPARVPAAFGLTPSTLLDDAPGSRLPH